MKKPTDLGKNKTGIDMSPLDSKAMLEIPRMTQPTSTGDEQKIAEARALYIKEGMPVGTVPPPGTLKGVAASTMKKLTGKKPEVLIDKLGERLGFERAGTRLYEALIGKCESHPDASGVVSIDTLRRFRDEEHKHMLMVRDAVLKIGADATVQTPCADVAGVASMGLLQVMTDPRTTVPQCLEAILIAELADNDAWGMLIDLCQSMGFKEMAGDFKQARAEEDVHLQTIRQWLSEILIKEEARAA